MGVSLDDIYADVNRLLLYNDAHGLSILSEDDRKNIIKSSVRQYSKKRPNLLLQAYVGTTADWYDLPSSFERGFSYIHEIEYPVENTPPDYIKQKDFKIDLMGSGWKLRFNANNPTTGETFWVKYSLRHVFDSNDASDIPVGDQTALSYLCMSNICDALADHYANKSDPNLSEAEAITQPNRVEEYTGKANDWMKKYNNELKDDEDMGIIGQVGFINDPLFDRSQD